ncbi:MAG: putative phage tail protein [Aquisalimonadaceae bacterium]
MVLTAEQYREQLIALQPPGQALPTNLDSSWAKLLQATADALARVDARAADLLRESDPRSALELLTDWERVTDLPDPCRGADPGGLGERRAEIEARLVARGSQIPAYFVEIAGMLGYDIEITEPPVSISGVLIAGDELSAAHEDRYAWRVRVPVDLSSAFVAGDELGYYRPTELECLLRRLKPAQTIIEFEHLSEE